eukprot:TRINITY_DN23412_c0_g1_i1.p1 TRINITY_DN23412_c0_g1~~TRINITY_DN23412_c0_g1_i1.p1  ORF type:complete len:266 (+),score=37.73 TRINITY_DN23412_c0_g1_i1:82-879(+)
MGVSDLHLTVTSLGGPLCTIPVDASWCCLDVKDALLTVLGIPVLEQRLVAGKSELLDSTSVADFHESDVMLVRRSPEHVKWLQSLQAVGDLKADILLRDAADEIRADRLAVLLAVSKLGYALQFAPSELRADREVVLSAVRRSGNALEFASSDLRADRHVVLAAVRRHGAALRYAAEALKNDREVVMEAVRQEGWALQFADEALQRDPEIAVVAAKRQNGHAHSIFCAARAASYLTVHDSCASSSTKRMRTPSEPPRKNSSSGVV